MNASSYQGTIASRLRSAESWSSVEDFVRAMMLKAAQALELSELPLDREPWPIEKVSSEAGVLKYSYGRHCHKDRVIISPRTITLRFRVPQIGRDEEHTLVLCRVDENHMATVSFDGA